MSQLNSSTYLKSADGPDPHCQGRECTQETFWLNEICTYTGPLQLDEIEVKSTFECWEMGYADESTLQGEWSEFLAPQCHTFLKKEKGQYFFIQRNEAANRVRGPCEEEQLEEEGCLLS